MNAGATAPPTRPRRVVYVTSSRGVGGGEQLILALVAAGQTLGWEQTVLNPFADAASGALAERCAPARYEAYECSSVVGVPATRAWLARRLNDLQPDIVHVILFHATVLTASVRRRSERRLLTHMYGEGLAQLAHPRVRGRLDRWAGRTYDHVSAISDAVQGFLMERYGYPPPAVGRIRLGWSGEPRPRAPATNRPPTIVCVAGLRREKGHDTLLAAFAAVRDAIPAARLVLVGDGPHRATVEAAVRAAGLTDSVRLTGATTDIWPHLADADVFALASPSEALGIAIMEAMAAGLPVVASDVGGIPELVVPGVTGELFAVRDHAEMARKLIALLASAPDLARMSAAAREAAEAMRMERTVAENLSLYDRLLEEDGEHSGRARSGRTNRRADERDSVDVAMKQRARALARALFLWRPLNVLLTDALRVVLPARLQRHDAFVRYARRVGVVSAALPDGADLRLYSRGDDGISGPVFWQGWSAHEPETAPLFYELARSARVTLDIGAHVGYFALLASHANPSGHVYAFEPLARVRERLERNLAINGASNVTCVPLAVGSPGGTAEFFHVREGFPSSSSLSSRFMHSIVPSAELTSSTVEVVEVDDYVQAHAITGVDLVKIDTETTEAAVFRGMLATLRRDRPDVICEVLDAGVAAAIEGLLQPLGYEFHLLTGDGPVRCAHITPDPVWRNFILRPAGAD